MSEKMMTREEWEKEFDKTQAVSDIDEREAKIKRISSDPAPQWREEAPKDYPTVEKHFLFVINEREANESLPEARDKYGSPHEIGRFLVSDRRDIPKGFAKKLKRGTPIEEIKDQYPEVYAYWKEKGYNVFD